MASVILAVVHTKCGGFSAHLSNKTADESRLHGCSSGNSKCHIDVAVVNAVGHYRTRSVGASNKRTEYILVGHVSKRDIYSGIINAIAHASGKFLDHIAEVPIGRVAQRAGGHQTDVRVHLKGSMGLRDHLESVIFSQDAINEGGYDKVILQDGGFYHAVAGYGDTGVVQGRTITYDITDYLRYTKNISAAVREKSPNSDIILENLWSFSYKKLNNWLGFAVADAPGWIDASEWNAMDGWQRFDRCLWKGVTDIATADPNINWISPISKAFTNARNNHGFAADYNYLLWSDNYHGGRYGMYLKACVDYLIMFGDKFENAGNNRHFDCDIPHDVAVKLRQAAEEVVFGGDGIQQFHYHDK